MIDTRDDGLWKTAAPERDPVETLLRLAGPRDAVPSERAARVRRAVRARWHQRVRARSRVILATWSLGAATAAALVLLALGLSVGDGSSPPVLPAEVASVEIVSGGVERVPAPGVAESAALRVGEAIRAGTTLRTTVDGGAALRLTGGAGVRVDRATRLQVISASVLLLEEGAVYVEAESGREPNGLEVRTKLGVARDIGTRFEVRLDESALRLRVRDGRVALSRGDALHDAAPGDELTLDEDGTLRRRTIAVYGPEWAWTAALTAPFELEGRSLREFLDWICGENGWRLRFADAVVERRAATTVLHGSIQGFTPEEALAAVLPTAGVEHELREGILSIR